MRKTLLAIPVMALILAPAAAWAIGPFGGDPIVEGCRSKIHEAKNRTTSVIYPEIRDDVADLISQAEREERTEDFKACYSFAELALMQIDRSASGQAGPGARVP